MRTPARRGSIWLDCVGIFLYLMCASVCVWLFIYGVLYRARFCEPVCQSRNTRIPFDEAFFPRQVQCSGLTRDTPSDDDANCQASRLDRELMERSKLREGTSRACTGDGQQRAEPIRSPRNAHLSSADMLKWGFSFDDTMEPLQSSRVLEQNFHFLPDRSPLR